MINEYAMRDKIAAMTNSERAALPRIKNQNAPDYASCPRCRHYHAMMPAQAAIPADGYFNFNYCRDCGALAVVVKADADIIDFESPVTVTAPEATEAAADDEVTDFERAATVAAPQKQRLTKTQEVNLEFLTERVSEMMGGLDYLTTSTLNNEGAGYTGTLIAEELRAAIESLRKARKLARNVINEH